MEVDVDDGSLLLYCDEDPFVSTPPPPPTTTTTTALGDEQEEAALMDDDEAAALLLVMEYRGRERMRCYAAARETDYLAHLQDQDRGNGSGLSSARSRAVHYIIYASARLGLEAATAFNAVNYLDRFFSINTHLSWEVWMVEVVSVACLSVACKLDQVAIPSLHDLQMEEAMSNSFRASTIMEMELTLLKALQWRLACVTPFSFLHLLLPAAGAAASRCTRLLLASLSEPSLLRFDASVVAASALRCVAIRHEYHHLHSRLTNLIPQLCQMDNEADECFKMMKAICESLDDPNNHKYSDQLWMWSPTSVITFQTDSIVNRSAVGRRLFGRPTPTPDGGQGEDTPHTHMR